MVSIRTRPEGRVNRRDAPDRRARSRRFNPHPARGPGESGGDPDQPARALVSIRTRPEGRVNRSAAGADRRARAVSIRTRPEGRVNRMPSWPPDTSAPSFNPHPARGPGESKRPSRRRLFPSCFNPHPARGPGESLRAARSSAGWCRFNPHPARGPGESIGAAQRLKSIEWFQSAPGPRAG